MDAKDALRAVVKHWFVFSLAVIVGVVAGALMVFRAEPRYGSSVTFFVSTPAADDASALASDQFATRRVNSYVRLARSDKLADLILADTNLDIGEQALRRELSGSADLNTVMLTIRVVDTDKQRSLRIASSVATQFPAMIGEIDNAGGAKDRVHLTVVSGPRLNPVPIRPSRMLNLGLGIVAGLVIGLALAVFRELLDKSIRSQDALRDVVDYPVLGTIRRDSAAKAEPLLVGRQVRSIRAEELRQIRTNLQFMSVDEPAHIIVVTSSVAEEGKSTTAANLAIVFAESGRRTLLIEADLRRPRVSEYLGLDRSRGLSNVLAGQVRLEDVLQPWGDGTLVVLASGTLPPNPSEILGSHGMSDLLVRLRERFDLILIDTPPILPVTDAAVASVQADGVVLVVRAGQTSRAQVKRAADLLEAVDARVLGTVLNMAPVRRSSSSAYDGYGYRQDAVDTPAAPQEEKIRVGSAEADG